MERLALKHRAFCLRPLFSQLTRSRFRSKSSVSVFWPKPFFFTHFFLHSPAPFKARRFPAVLPVKGLR
jgi:hypothetical protein